MDDYILVNTMGRHIPVRVSYYKLDRVWVAWLSIDILKRRWRKWDAFLELLDSKSIPYALGSTQRKSVVLLSRQVKMHMYRLDEGKSVIVNA